MDMKEENKAVTHLIIEPSKRVSIPADKTGIIRRLTGKYEGTVKPLNQEDLYKAKFTVLFTVPSGKSSIREDNKENVVFNGKKYKIKED